MSLFCDKVVRWEVIVLLNDQWSWFVNEDINVDNANCYKTRIIAMNNQAETSIMLLIIDV